MLLFLLLQSASPDVVVTGQRLVEAQQACARGGCTVLRDAQATVALAEAMFRDGEYLKAKQLLLAGVARNRAHAASDPKPVAALYEALSTVAIHEGDREVYRRAVANRVRTLRDNLPGDDPTVVSASGALAEMWMRLGQYQQAQISFRSAETIAERAGNARGAMLVAMKRAWVAALAGERDRAQAMLAALEQRPLARDPAYRVALRVLGIRIAARFATDDEIVTLARMLGQEQGAMPTLIWAPPYADGPLRAANKHSERFDLRYAIPPVSQEIDGVQWIDIGFWIRPDGSTAEPEVLRGSTAHDWDRYVLRQVARRRYSPTRVAEPARSDGAVFPMEGVYRVERVTLKSAYMVPIGSLVPRRISTGGFEILDLTEGSAAPRS